MSLLGDGSKSATRTPVRPQSASPKKKRHARAFEVDKPVVGAATLQNTPGTQGILSTCANPQCATGWLHLWRSRSRPVFEGGWNCSATCTLTRMEAAVRRELDGRRREAVAHRHRVPLGLVMLEQGWISADQLRQSLSAQKKAGGGRLGNWLMRQQGVSEKLITRALSLQWSCPVLTLDYYDAGAMAPMFPRLFVEAFGALPLRVAAGQILYLGFEENLDPAVAFAIEQMTGLQVEIGLIPSQQFQTAKQRLVCANFPHAELIEAASEAPLTRVLARALERSKPADARLVRVHDCLWLRMWASARTQSVNMVQTEGAGIEDVICSLVAG